MTRRERKIKAMHEIFGMESNTCEHCKHFIIYEMRNNRRIFKCGVYGDSDSEATDWRKKYIACGLFNRDTEHQNIYKTLAPTKKEIVLDGQQQFDVE